MKSKKLPRFGHFLCNLVLAVIAIGCFEPRPSQAQSDVASQISAILDSTYSPDMPGATVIATRGDETVFRGARGMADLELNVSLKPEMVLRLGSITKQFTAAAIMKLVEEKKLSLDDELNKFLPDYPTHGKTITVEHLLTHTSGIQSYTNMPGWMQTKIKQDLSVDELIDGFKKEPMEFDPGERFNYNNSGYVLLGAIIEKASGKSYEEFVGERIFQPLGMEHSYYGNHRRIIPNRASGYGGSPEQPGNAQYLSMSQPYAAGSLLSTVDDLARWNKALFSGKVVSESSVERMITPHKLTDGTTTGYGYGLMAADLRGHRAIQHGGGIFGFSTYGVYLPDDDVYVAILTNSSSPAVAPTMLGNRIAALVAGDPYPARVPVKVAPEVLKQYLGVYRIDDKNTRTVSFENGKLYTLRSGGQRLEAVPSSETEFYYKTTLSHFEFVKNDKGQVTGMKMYQNGAKKPELAKKTNEQPKQRQVVEVDPDIYDDYVGEYQLGPGFVLTVSREGDRLMTQATGQSKVEVFPESETVYFLKVVDAQLTFVRGDDGKVDKLILKQAGREIPAKRIAK